MIALLMRGHFLSLLLLVVVVPTTIMNIIYEIRYYMYDANPVSERVYREKQISIINANSVVDSDTLYVDKQSIVFYDGLIQEGEIIVDESMVNGSSELVNKKEGDTILKGSKIVYGSAYVSVHQAEEKKTKVYSKFSKSHKIMALSAWLFAIIAIILLVLNIAKYSNDFDSNLVNVLETIAFIFPAGLYLFYTALWFVNSYRLKKNHVSLNDRTAISSFGKIDTICIDKTNTLTTGGYVIKTISPITHIDQNMVNQILSNILLAVNDDSEISKNLKSSLVYGMNKGLLEAIPFNPQNNYIGASFTGNKSYIVGEPDNMNLNDKAGILRRRDTFTKEGYHVYLLAEASLRDKTLKYNGLAYILLIEEVKEETLAALLEMKQRGIDIKILSGDNEFKCRDIALKLGNEKILSLKNRELEDVKKVVPFYDVFVDCNEEQKLVIVKALQEDKKKVAMIGDGDNDVLALKQADASLCMERGTSSAKAVSAFILEDNDLSHLSSLVEEGNIHKNSLFKIFSLYAMKTVVFSSIFIAYLLISLFSGIQEITFPFAVSSLYAYELFCVVVPLCLAIFDKNSGVLQRKSIVFAIFSTVICSITMAAPFILFALQTNNLLYTTFSYDSFLTPYTSSSALGVGIILITFMPLLLSTHILFYPLKKKNIITLSVLVGLPVLVLVADFVIYLLNQKDILGIPFGYITDPSYFVGLAIIFIATSLYFIVMRIIEILYIKNEKKEEKSNDQN